MKSFVAKSAEVERKWHLVDASQMSVGRLAARIAKILMGKTKPTYTPGVDTGDFVVVTNAAQLVVTGRKAEQKVYRHHSGWVGGLKEISFRQMMERHPDRIIQLAVRRMMPKTKLGQKQMTKLKIYPGTEHPHEA
ncbi:MAG: 50S ribosomal protein L13, partial [Planctomycetes bacterium]|nr:50S ribosomal protein L13 [Planctomycetota bacterium]